MKGLLPANKGDKAHSPNAWLVCAGRCCAWGRSALRVADRGNSGNIAIQPLGAKHMAKVEREYLVKYDNVEVRPHWQPLVDKAKAHYRAGKDAMAELEALVNADYTSDGLPSHAEALVRFGFDGKLRAAIAKRKPGSVAKSNGSANELSKYLSDMRQSGRAS
jgi:hypothetical protein